MFGTMKVIVIYNKVFFIYKSTNRIAPIIMYMSDKPTNPLGLNWVTRKVYYLSVAWFKYDSVGIFSSLILKWNFFSNTFSFSWPKQKIGLGSIRGRAEGFESVLVTSKFSGSSPVLGFGPILVRRFLVVFLHFIIFGDFN